MKKLFTLLALTVALFLGSQDAQAQETQKASEAPEVVAKEKVNELNEQLQLNGEQQTALFRAYVAQDYNYNKYLKVLDANSAEYKTKKAEYDNNLNETAKNVLTTEQYTKFQALQKKK
ncbi:MAG TPA: hypothetical protein VFM70_04800 [Salinimicrobium sp.]|nr:hypothetical protein [Salinimicrobium sp.]